MASLKEMRNRISSVKATQKITKAMQMVAAAKLRRSQDAAEAARPYARRLASVIANLAAGVSGDGAPALLTGTGRDDRHLVIVAAADRGLAGGFNGGGGATGAAGRGGGPRRRFPLPLPETRQADRRGARRCDRRRPHCCASGRSTVASRRRRGRPQGHRSVTTRETRRS